MEIALVLFIVLFLGIAIIVLRDRAKESTSTFHSPTRKQPDAPVDDEDADSAERGFPQGWGIPEPPPPARQPRSRSDKKDDLDIAEFLRRRPAPPDPEGVQFSAYYPKEVMPDQWRPLLAYVFRADTQREVAVNAKQQLGDQINAYRKTGQPSKRPLETGATVTATPVLDGFQFNPSTISIGFYEDWHRFDFKLRATDAPLDRAANGQITFSVEGIVVADIPLAIYVGEAATDETHHSATRKPYDTIFCSYSRQDLQIVERIERAYRLLGMNYLRDLVSIRSGEAWNDSLKTMIDRADIFQLFWSPASATSQHVQMEWAYALSLPNKAANFIRPVFWVQPMPTPPEPLQHLHFAYEPGLDD